MRRGPTSRASTARTVGRRSLKRVVRSAASTLVVLACASGSTSRLPERAAILPTSRAPELLDQCSRPSVSPVEGFWQPDAAAILELEEGLPGFLARPDVRSPSAPLERYYRQYAGVVSRGERLIYASFLHESVLASPGELRWRTQPVVVCDGGDWFWGITYDPRSHEFGPPQYNGEA